MNVLSIVVAVLPVFLIGLFVYMCDKIKDPSKFLFKLFMFGVLSCFPTVFVGSILDIFFPSLDDMNFLQLFVYVFVSIALVEEFFKWFFLYKCSYNHEEFDSTYDMIVYAVFVSLGFACFENILYVSSYGISTGLIRAVSAVPGHACYGILMGMYLGIAKIKEIDGNFVVANKYKMLSLLIPTIAHGIYDYCVFSGSTLFLIIFFNFIFIIDIYCFLKVKEISKNSIKFKRKVNFCSNCGVLVDSKYCTNCGNKIM